MSERVMTTAMKQLRRIALLHDFAALTDGQLLDRYVNHRDEAAFAAIVRRHGPMVWGVCRRTISSHHDAEDAFQATFLVLVNKAAGISPRDMVAHWLHGVACNTAIKARSIAARRHSREQCRSKIPEPAVMDSALENDADLRRVIDRELSRLPDKYRVPIVLCDLSGTSYKDAARQIGCPAGTLAARLSRARALLAKRLARYGITASAATVELALASSAEAVPSRVLASAIQTAFLMAAGQVGAGILPCQVAVLTKGVLHAMLWNKLKIGIVVFLALGIFGTGAGMVRYAVVGAEPRDAKKEKPAQTTPAQDLDQVEKLLEQAREILKKQRTKNDRDSERQMLRRLEEEARRIEQQAQDKIELDMLLKKLDALVQRQQDKAVLERIVTRLNAMVKKLQQKKTLRDKFEDVDRLRDLLKAQELDAIRSNSQPEKPRSQAKDYTNAINFLEIYLKAQPQNDKSSKEIKRLEEWLKARPQAGDASDGLQRQKMVDDLNSLIQKMRKDRNESQSAKPK